SQPATIRDRFALYELRPAPPRMEALRKQHAGDGRDEPGLNTTSVLDSCDGTAARDQHRLGCWQARCRAVRPYVHDHAAELGRDQDRLPRADPHPDGFSSAPARGPATERYGRAPLR